MSKASLCKCTTSLPKSEKTIKTVPATLFEDSDNIDDIKKASGIRGMLQSFNRIVEDCGPKSTIAYVGIPFTCTPIIDFLVYSTRGTFNKVYYVPEANGELAYELELGKHRIESSPVGMPVSVDIVVLMGGLSMPQKWDISEARGMVGRLSHEGTKLVGVCFMDMFKKSGWIRELPFDYVENCYVTTDAYKNNSENKLYSQSLE